MDATSWCQGENCKLAWVNEKGLVEKEWCSTHISQQTDEGRDMAWGAGIKSGRTTKLRLHSVLLTMQEKRNGQEEIKKEKSRIWDERREKKKNRSPLASKKGESPTTSSA